MDFVLHHMHCKGLWNRFLTTNENNKNKAKPPLVFIRAPNFNFKTEMKNYEPIL